MMLKAFYSRLMAAFPNLRKLTASVLGGTWGVTLPCSAMLLVFYWLETAGMTRSEGAAPLTELLISLIAAPAAAGMITYAAAASWESRRATIVDAYHLARIRMKEIGITGLAAGAIVLIANWIASIAYSLIGIIPALLGWIPVVGPVVTAAVSLVFWLISATLEFAAHAALVMGMLPLTADGVTGRAQAERALSILQGSRENILYELGLVLILWLAAQGIYVLGIRFAPLPGALIGDLLRAAMTAVSMTAISVIYLKERDKRDGMRFHG